jgi:hypothetical protein
MYGDGHYDGDVFHDSAAESDRVGFGFADL